MRYQYNIHKQRSFTQYSDNNSGEYKTKYYVGGNYELEDNNGRIRGLNYVYSPDGLVSIVETDEQNEIVATNYIYKDHLGSIYAISDENGHIKEHNGDPQIFSYDAWGNRRDYTNWTQSYTAENTLFDRGYTGHQMLDEFGIIEMNGRIYDPVIGRFFSPDPYIQSPDNTQNFNRYSYVLNNPLKYTDPSGELYLMDDLIVGGISFAGGYIYNGVTTGDWGWSSVKTGAIWAGTSLLALNTMGLSFSPAFAAKIGGQMVATNVMANLAPSLNIPIGNNASINISPTIIFGSNQTGIGINVSGTMQHNGFSLTVGGRYTEYGLNFGGSSSELVKFWSAGYSDGTNGFSYSNSYFSSGHTSQATGAIALTLGEFSLRYENDYMFGLPADGGDRYRTAAAKIGYGNFSAGVNLFTGDPGLDGYSRTTEKINGRDTYTSGTSNKYRAGIGYIGYGNFRYGRDSEHIRHIAQNRFAHDILMGGKSPYFKVLNIEPKGYYSYGNHNPYSLW